MRKITAVFDLFRNLIANHRCPQGEITARDSLGQRHQVGIDFPKIACEPIAEPPKARDDFVRHEQNIVLAAKLA